MRLETSASTLTGNNHPQHTLCRSDRHGRLADEFAVGVDIDGRIRGQIKTCGLKVFDFLELQVIAAVDGREEPQKFGFRHGSDDARIKQTVGHVGIWRNLHSAPVPRRVRKSGEHARDRTLRLTVNPQIHLGRSEASQGYREAQGIASICSQPARKVVGDTRGGGIQADTSDAGEISGLFCYRAEARNDSEIHRSDVVRALSEQLPYRGGLSKIFDIQGAGKIVAATSRHNQHRQLQSHQLAEMPMDSTVAAKDENCVETCRFSGDSELKTGSVLLETSQVGWRGSETQDGGGTHRGRLTDSENQEARATSPVPYTPC
jgi:hypothetical protein